MEVEQAFVGVMNVGNWSAKSRACAAACVINHRTVTIALVYGALTSGGPVHHLCEFHGIYTVFSLRRDRNHSATDCRSD